MIQSTLFLISYIFLIAIVIVYFDYVSRIDVVSRYLVYLRGYPDVSGRVVVRAGDICVGSSVLHPLYVGLAWARSRRR